MTAGTHSPLGASGASRWMKCPGSVPASVGIDDPESEHAALGTAAHELGAKCLAENVDPWEFMGEEFYGIEADRDMVKGVTQYVDWVRWSVGGKANLKGMLKNSQAFVEEHFACPEIHPLFYGTADFVMAGTNDAGADILHVWDYKNGRLQVDAVANPQLMYYGLGALTELRAWDEFESVRLHIVQPNSFHPDGAHLDWEIPVVELANWRDRELIPAMDRAVTATEDDLVVGEHCRWCVVADRCPALLNLLHTMQAIQEKDPDMNEFDNQTVGEIVDAKRVLKPLFEKAEQTAYARMIAGAVVPFVKLVKKKSNRAWKKGAEAAIKKIFGAGAYTELTLKSPAQIDTIPGGSEHTARWSEKPDTGLTLAPASDVRPAITGDAIKSNRKRASSDID